MTLTLVARVVDVTGAPQPKASAYVIDGEQSTAMTATKQPGVFEYTLPASLTSPKLSVGLQGFWTVTQGITITTPGGTPTASYSGKQHLNVRGLPVVNSRAGGHDIVIDVVLGQLRDATAQVTAAAAEASIRTSLGPQDLLRFNTPILKGNGSGTDLLDGGVHTIDPGGPLFFAERVSAPSLIALVNPGWPIKTGSDAGHFPLHYHVFLHPTIPAGWSDDYPFGVDYLDLVSRYVLKPWSAGGKAMAYQNRAQYAKNILVFPVGDKSNGLSAIASQASMLRFLLEINYFFQRVRGASIPRMPLGGAGISAFSSAGGYVTSIMNGAKDTRFHDKVLRFVGLFDCLGANASAMRSKLLAWHRKGEDNRHLRIYTQKAAWQVYEQDFPSATKTTVAGATELEEGGFTLLYTPLAFWQQMKPNATEGTLHQLFPAWFMEHAVSRSSFTPPV